MLAAQEVYLGGHVYEITQAQADALEAAGYQTFAAKPSGVLIHGVDILST